MGYMETYNRFLGEAKNPEDYEELISIKDNEDEIRSRFENVLSFGTAGLRGIIGIGTNRMNLLTVGWASQGLADYINNRYGGGEVAIAYDSRNMSKEFAEHAASVLAANSITVYIFRELMPTPMLSFAVRELKCKAGIVITASHNPAQYNGYKVYGSDGCQMTTEDTNAVVSRLNTIDMFSDVHNMSYEDAVEIGLVKYISNKVINDYFRAVAEEQLNPGICLEYPISVVYTPLNGAGNKPVRRILEEIGVSDISVVKEQELPDGDFPTAPYPNPEMREALELGLKLCKEVKPDIFIATDPDADRVGFAVRRDGEYRILTGNEVGILLLHYIITAHKQKRTMPENPITIRSVVSSTLVDRIAEDEKVEVITVLTGFKNIGEQILLLEQKKEEHRFIFGFEESCGYLAGSYVRDKDAVFASMMLAEMTSYFRSRNQSLVDVLENIYKKYGYYVNTVVNLEFSGLDGNQEMSNIMTSLRENVPQEIAGLSVIKYLDYENKKRIEVSSGDVSNISLPSTNMVAFILEGGAEVMIRPSGTEPKMKIYITTAEKDLESSKMLTERLVLASKDMVKDSE